LNLSQFFEHWRIEENPFRGEEARHDAVFARMARIGAPPPDRAQPAAPPQARAEHSDFEKVLGDLARPSTSIVFGEKGSGKTAMRLQLADAVRAHNASRDDSRVFLIDYDDLNGVLDRFHAHVAEGKHDPAEALERIRLVDHIDAILATGVTRLTSAVLGVLPDGAPNQPGPAPRTARRADPSIRRTMLLLQAVYDRGERPDERTPRLRRALGLFPAWRRIGRVTLIALGWLPAAIWLYVWLRVQLDGWQSEAAFWALVVCSVGYAALLAKLLLWDRFVLGRLAARLRRQQRTAARSERSFAASLAQLDPSLREPDALPLTDSDDIRYAMLDRFRAVLAAFGYSGIVVLVDRVDEPTLISGDPERMRAVVWPMLNNKFLQQDGFGLKLLLPIELRHALFKESSAFFQEARLDKQSLVERLTWTGAMLYDVCDARLRACRSPAAEPVALLDLFAEDVTRQDLVDALDQMHQPRDAFKFLYACLSEHCSNVTADQEAFRIPSLVLEQVRNREAERLQQLYRGIRPA